MSRHRDPAAGRTVIAVVLLITGAAGLGTLIYLQVTGRANFGRILVCSVAAQTDGCAT